ncbi:hypothetical protein LAZ40_01390, partial [Cereibacter sphaeroides]|uniref:hypothetical protein n=1 Tax=Cereibacter sphaeroides TaxID=1063 RepID=UPI001F2B1877
MMPSIGTAALVTRLPPVAFEIGAKLKASGTLSPVVTENVPVTPPTVTVAEVAVETVAALVSRTARVSPF